MYKAYLQAIRLVAILITLFLSIPLYSQSGNGKLFIMPNIGFNVHKANGNFVYFESAIEQSSPEYVMGLNLGAELHYEVFNVWDFSVGLAYNEYGSKYSEFSNGNEHSLSMHYGEKLDLGYISMPISAALSIGHTKLKAKVGMQLCYLVAANFKYTEDYYTYQNGAWTFESQDK